MRPGELEGRWAEMVALAPRTGVTYTKQRQDLFTFREAAGLPQLSPLLVEYL